MPTFAPGASDGRSQFEAAFGVRCGGREDQPCNSPSHEAQRTSLTDIPNRKWYNYENMLSVSSRKNSGNDMSDVQTATQTIKTCFGKHYSLPYFQREYKWETRHFLELINDIQGAFLIHFDRESGRKAVANYAPYFLGSIITAGTKDAKKPLIDGQQRLTSIFILLAFLKKFGATSKAPTLDLSSFIGSVSYGQMDYTIEFGEKRKEIFDVFLDDANDFETALTSISELGDLTESDRRIVAALRSIQDGLDEVVLANIEYFTDYVMERVLIIDISVETESEAHRVFVTMNDRGLRLSPIDLLKGQILSRIVNDEDTSDCHEKWTNTFARLKDYDPEEDSLFIRTFFRSKWANTTRGKSQGAEPGDFDIIGDAYHRWFDDNLSTLGLEVADDFADFVRVDVQNFAKAYMFIKDAEENLTEGYESVYYNSIRRFGPQSMILLSAIGRNDSTKVWKSKVSLLSKLIDLILTTRSIEGKRNTYDNVKDIAFSLTKAVRNMNEEPLKAYVMQEWDTYFPIIEKLPDLEYKYADRSDLLFILARCACFLEEAQSESGKGDFNAYWARDKGAKTYDIEHILPKPFSSCPVHSIEPFSDEAEYGLLRNRIGALVLLPRSRNRSLQDKPYKDKIEVYKTENILTKTLTNGFYENNPRISAFMAKHEDVKLASCGEFGKPEIASRGELYTNIARLVWSAPDGSDNADR